MPCKGFGRALLLGICAAVPHLTEAATLRVLCTPALAPAMPDLIRLFEDRTGHTIRIDYVTAGAMRKRLRKEQGADVAISTGPIIGALAAESRVSGETYTEIGRVGIGVQVRRGSHKPDVSSVEAFRHAALNARTIGYIDPAAGGAAGIHVRSVLERLGVADVVGPRSRLIGGANLVDAVAAGEVELGLAPISEIMSDPRVELAGPLPPEIQDVTILIAAVVTGTNLRTEAAAFTAFLGSSASAASLRMFGLRD